MIHGILGIVVCFLVISHVSMYMWNRRRKARAPRYESFYTPNLWDNPFVSDSFIRSWARAWYHDRILGATEARILDRRTGRHYVI